MSSRDVDRMLGTLSLEIGRSIGVDVSRGYAVELTAIVRVHDARVGEPRNRETGDIPERVFVPQARGQCLACLCEKVQETSSKGLLEASVSPASARNVCVSWARRRSVMSRRTTE